MNYDCLIVDDEAALSQSTCEYFNMFGVRTAWAPDAEACLDFLRDNRPGLILLDINLGNSSGFDLCKHLRGTTGVPILFISARTSDDDMLLALNIGGDDYIPKPYSLSVLLAKVKAVLKRAGGSGDNPLPSASAPLKAMERKLLAYLVKNKGRVVTKDELFREVWEDTIVGDNTLNVHIRRLREKIEKDPNEPRLIKTVWGTGYVFGDAASREGGAT